MHLSQAVQDKLIEHTRLLARGLQVVGLVNIQYIVAGEEVYIIEVNPRSSRTIPYISKVTGIPMVDLATRVMLGERLADLGYGTGLAPESGVYAIKVPVFSFEKLPDVEVSLGPEMKSTGEVLGLSLIHIFLPAYRVVDTCTSQLGAVSPYYYSTYNRQNQAHGSAGKSVVVLGSGPIRIGQGIEFDYCSVHCVWALKQAGYETIIINNNPETVSTDFDTADKLYLSLIHI